MRNTPNPNGFLLFSPTKVSFPNVCATCGAATDHKITIKVSAGEPGLKPTILLGHVGHMIEAAESLRAGSASVPCCRTCYRPHVVGRSITIGCLIAAPILLGIIFKFASSWPDWLTISLGFVCMVMFFGSFIPHLVGQGKAMPVTIWRTSKGYFYHFYSGIFRTWAESQGVDYQEIPTQK